MTEFLCDCDSAEFLKFLLKSPPPSLGFTTRFPKPGVWKVVQGSLGLITKILVSQDDFSLFIASGDSKVSRGWGEGGGRSMCSSGLIGVGLGSRGVRSGFRGGEEGGCFCSSWWEDREGE